MKYVERLNEVYNAVSLWCKEMRTECTNWVMCENNNKLPKDDIKCIQKIAKSNC